MSDLNQPGATKTSKRVYIETIAPAVKETREEGGDVWVDQEEFEPVFEPQKTYVHLEIELKKPVVPEKSDLLEPVPKDIVSEKKLIKWPFSKTANDDFCKQVSIAVKALTREYHTMFASELQH